MSRVTMGVCPVNSADIESVSNTLSTGFLSNGPEMKEFERKFSSYHGYSYGVMVNSGQSALEAALELAKYKLNKKNLNVLVPSTTYAATLWAVIRTDNHPVFCDVSCIDYNLDIDRYIEDEFFDIDVVMPVDLCGKECNTSMIRKKFPKALIIRDSCEASGLKVESYSDIACFSFYVSHLITCGSGGMVCVKSEKDSEYIRSFIAHGRSHDGDFTKHSNEWKDKFCFDKVGASYRSDNMSASLGLSQFNRLEEFVFARKRNAKYLIDKYEDSDILKTRFVFPDREYWENCVFQFFPIVIKDDTIDTKHFLNYLYQKGIDSRVLLSLTNQPIFKEIFGDIEECFQNSKNLNYNGFVIGCHQGLGFDDMQFVIDCFKEYNE